MTELYPWFAAPLARLAARLPDLPHAWLLHGQSGLGKNAFALSLARTLLCRAPRASGEGCETCVACRLWAAGTHPDLHLLRPEAQKSAAETRLDQYAARYDDPPTESASEKRKLSRVIRIDQTRALIERLQKTAQLGGRRVAILTPAESARHEAANSLLKLLEEPPAGVFFLLVTDEPDRLPATILSRCTRLQLDVPAKEMATRWLQQTGHEADQDAGSVSLALSLCQGAPLRARDLLTTGQIETRRALWRTWRSLISGKGEVRAVTGHMTGDPRQALLWMETWFNDLIVLGSGCDPLLLYNADLTLELRELALRLDLACLFRERDRLLDLLPRLDTGLDRQLQMEGLLAGQCRLLIQERT